MRISSVIHLYLIRLRSRLVQELLALAGITVGVALVFAALVANTSLTGSVRELTEGVVGNAALEVASRGPEGFDERVLDVVNEIDGVRAAAPVVEARANVVGPQGRQSVVLIGGDERFANLGGTLLPFSTEEVGTQRALGVPGPIAAELGVSLSEPLELEIGHRTVPFPLVAQLTETDIGNLIDNPIVLTSLPVAQALSDTRGRITRIFVEVEPGRAPEVAAALQRVAGDRLTVRDADFEVDVFKQAAYPTNQSTTLFSVFSALVGFLFAFSAVLLTVPQRRRLIADLRMSGHEAWALVQLLLFDALVLGVAGVACGLLLGDQLSRHLFDAAPGYLSSAFPVGSQRIVTWQSLAIAACTGILAACIAVLAPLRDILAQHPLAAARPEGARRGETYAAIAGVLCLAVTTVIVVAAPSAAMAGLVALTLALLLLLPLLLRMVTRLFELAVRALKSPVPTLALIGLRSRSVRSRTLALAATGAIAVFAAVAIGGAHADLERGLDGTVRDVDGNADIWVTFRGEANTFATTPFGELGARAEAIERIPGVRTVRGYRGSFLDIGDRRAWVTAPPRAAPRPVTAGQLTDGDATLASQRLREGGWLVLSEALADDAGVGVGDRWRLPSPIPTKFRIAAVGSNLGWPPGAIILNADDYARAWGSAALSGLHVGLEPGASPQEAKASIEHALGPQLPLDVETKAERFDRHYTSTRDGLARLTQISVLVLISAVLAMAAAMGGMIWQQRSTFAALKVHGFSDRELWSALMLESGLLLGAGCSVGAAFGLYGQLLLSRALETITGFPVFYSTAGLAALGILALVTAVAVAMLAVPGWLAVRVRPVPGAAG